MFSKGDIIKATKNFSEVRKLGAGGFGDVFKGWINGSYVAVKRLTEVSPRKSVELRMKNYEQLRYLQKLFDDRILNTKEYAEQKQSIIDSLRKLSLKVLGIL